jgi:hypothetical protein
LNVVQARDEHHDYLGERNTVDVYRNEYIPRNDNAVFRWIEAIAMGEGYIA